jgi:hypothetical protein
MRVRIAKRDTQPGSAINYKPGLGSKLIFIALYDVSVHSKLRSRVSDAEKAGKFIKNEKAAETAFIQIATNELLLL